MARDAGVSVSVIGSCMGHTSEKTTWVYLAEINHDILDEANNRVLSSWKNDEKNDNNDLLSYKRAGGKPTFCF